MDAISFLENKIKAMSLDDYEIYRAERRYLTAEARDGEIDSLDEAVERGVAVRLFRSGKCGFACASDGPDAFLERMLGLAYNSLSVVEEEETFDLPGNLDGEWEILPGSKSKTEKLEMALELERVARNFDRRITRVRDASYSEEVRTVTLKNSRGLEKTHSGCRYELSLMVMAEDKEKQEMAWDSEQTTEFSALNASRLAERTAEKAVGQLGGRVVKTQKTAAVLDPTVATSILGVLASSFFGDQVQKNRSALRNRKGEEIYSRQVHITDDGRLPGGYASFPFDGEGTPTARSALVVEGVLKGFLYDLSSAVKERTKGTGNGIRPNFKETPRVGATNFFIEQGRGTLKELLQEMGTGFWIRDVIGVHTANPVTGDFSLGASGHWVESGSGKYPVRGVTISGNLHDLLKRVVRVGGESRFYRSFGSPPLLIDAIDIGGI